MCRYQGSPKTIDRHDENCSLEIVGPVVEQPRRVLQSACEAHSLAPGSRHRHKKRGSENQSDEAGSNRSNPLLSQRGMSSGLWILFIFVIRWFAVVAVFNVEGRQKAFALFGCGFGGAFL